MSAVKDPGRRANNNREIDMRVESIKIYVWEFDNTVLQGAEENM